MFKARIAKKNAPSQPTFKNDVVQQIKHKLTIIYSTNINQTLD